MNKPNKIEPIPFQLAHLDFLLLREHERELIDNEKFVGMAEVGNCWTVKLDGRMLAVIGFLKIWDGVLEVFVVPGIYIKRYPKTFLKGISEWLESMWEVRTDVHRIETKSLADDRTDKWMRKLGFTCEGTHLQYTSKRQDYRTWARIRDGSQRSI